MPLPEADRGAPRRAIRPARLEAVRREVVVAGSVGGVRVAAREVVLPRVAHARTQRVVVALPLVDREFDRLVRAVVRHVLDDLIRRILTGRRRRRDAGARRDQRRRDAIERARRVVCCSADPVIAHIGDDERHRIAAGGTQRLERAGLIADTEIDEPDARAHSFGDLLLDVCRCLRRRRLLEIRIHRNRACEGGARHVAFLTRLIELVARDAGRAHFRVGPRIGDGLQRLVRVGVLGDADARVELVEAPVRLQHRLAITHHVVAQTEPRHDAIPFRVVCLGKCRCRNTQPARERIRELALVRREYVVVIPAHAEVQRKASDGVLVGEKGVDGVELRNAEQVAVGPVAERSDLRCRRRRHDHAGWQPVAPDVLADVAAIRLQVADPAGLQHDFAANLEVVRAAEPAVLEVGHRPGGLAPLPIGLLFLVGVQVL